MNIPKGIDKGIYINTTLYRLIIQFRFLYCNQNIHFCLSAVFQIKKKPFMNKFRLDFKISITQKCHHCIHNLYFTLKYNLSTYSNIVAWDWTGQATLLQFCGKLWLVLLWSRFIHILILHAHKFINSSSPWFILILPSKTTVKNDDKADLYLIRESIRWVLSVVIC